MENIKRVLEIRDSGPESAKIEDIPLALNLIAEFANINPEVQVLIKGIEITLVIDIQDVGMYNVTIKNGKCTTGTGKLVNPSFSLKTDLLTISKVLLGQLDATLAFFSKQVEVSGDLYYMIIFLNALEIAFEKFKIVDTGKRELIVSPKDMKKLLEIYNGEGGADDPSVITKFLRVFCAFLNNNQETQEEMSDNQIRLQLKIKGVGDYLMTVVDGKASWKEETANDATITIEMTLENAVNLVKTGDAVSAYMAGIISVNGNLQDGIWFQDLLALFIDFIQT